MANLGKREIAMFSRCESYPFTLQKDSFRSAISMLLQCENAAIVSYLHIYLITKILTFYWLEQ